MDADEMSQRSFFLKFMNFPFCISTCKAAHRQDGNHEALPVTGLDVLVTGKLLAVSIRGQRKGVGYVL